MKTLTVMRANSVNSSHHWMPRYPLRFCKVAIILRSKPRTEQRSRQFKSKRIAGSRRNCPETTSLLAVRREPPDASPEGSRPSAKIRNSEASLRNSQTTIDANSMKALIATLILLFGLENCLADDRPNIIVIMAGKNPRGHEVRQPDHFTRHRRHCRRAGK